MTAKKSSSEPTISDPGTRARAIWLAGLIGAALALILTLTTGERSSRAVFDLWQRAAPRDLTHSDVRLVLIESESLAKYGPWPWPRYHIGRLTEKIAAGRPAAIGFDMIFPEPDRVTPDLFAKFYPELSAPAAAEIRTLPAMDNLLGSIIGSAPVVLGRVGVTDDGVPAANVQSEAIVTGPLPPKVPTFAQALTNIPALEMRPAGHGLLNGPPDADGVIRHVPLVMAIGKRAMPGMALELARVGSGQNGFTLKPGTVTLGASTMPVDDRGRMELRFGIIPPEHIYSALEILDDYEKPQVFAGKTVLVGLAAEGTVDVVQTPLGGETYGMRVQGQAIDAILHGGWLSRPRWAIWTEWTVGAALVLLVLLSVRARRRWIAIPVIVALALPIMSFFAFDHASWLIDPLRPLVLGGGATLGLFFGTFREARKERERLRDTLVHERVTAAAAEGELQAARTIQLGMLPDRAAMSRLDPRVDVHARLEAAKSVGGDFYDIIRLDADRIMFLIADVTGKGVPAALFMALSKALTKSVLLRDGADLGDSVADINRELSLDSSDRTGLTMLLCLLDLRSGALQMVNAGHDNPLLVGTDGTVVDHPMDGGPPFCIVDFPYPVETLVLRPGEALVLITDGVTEAQNEAGELFGLQRARDVLANLRDASATALVDATCEAVHAYQGAAEASDDLTVLAFRYL